MTVEVEHIVDETVVELIPATLPSVLEVLSPREPTLVEVIGRGPQGPKGDAGTFNDLIQDETPTGNINGSNVDFSTTQDFDKIWVYKNGQRQTKEIDYTVTGANTFQFLYAPETGDALIVDYTLG